MKAAPFGRNLFLIPDTGQSNTAPPWIDFGGTAYNARKGRQTYPHSLRRRHDVPTKEDVMIEMRVIFWVVVAMTASSGLAATVLPRGATVRPARRALRSVSLRSLCWEQVPSCFCSAEIDLRNLKRASAFIKKWRTSHGTGRRKYFSARYVCNVRWLRRVGDDQRTELLALSKARKPVRKPAVALPLTIPAAN
jgi:hypothetical protein